MISEEIDQLRDKTALKCLLSICRSIQTWHRNISYTILLLLNCLRVLHTIKQEVDTSDINI